ncbi:Metallo-dependent phosphatase-like protein [Phycomyces blakesleeanus]
MYICFWNLILVCTVIGHFCTAVQAYITDIKLVTCNGHRACPNFPGYKKLETNLNAGTKRSQIYMHIKDDPSSDPITDLLILKTPDPPKATGWTRLETDLNHNTVFDNQTAIWLYFTKDKRLSVNPVTSIIIKEGDSPVVGAEYRRLPVDLNEGVGGMPLYMFYSQLGPKDPITALTAKACFTDVCYMDGWERVEKDANEGVIVGMRIYLFYQRKRNSPPVTDIVLVLDDQTAPEGYNKVEVDLNFVTFRGASIYLWYKTLSNPSEEEKSTAIQQVAIEYGQNAVAPLGWERLSVDLNSNHDGKGGFGEPTFLFIQRGYHELPPRQPLVFRKDGTFKIVQLADLHFTNEVGKCKDTPVEFDCKGDDSTIATIERLLDHEKPDLVVFGGDNIDGNGAVTDARAATFKFAEPVIKRKIPWVAVFGNHDDENDLTREELFEVIRRMPFSLNERGPLELPGTGNFALQVFSNATLEAHALTIYFLDSHGLATKDTYDSIDQEQLNWLQETSANYAQSGKGTQKPNALAFFHTPIWEYHGAEDKSVPKLGDQRETISSPRKKKNLSVLDAFVKAGDIKATGCGHDHVNDYCIEQKGIQLCYSGGLGIGGYGAAHLGWPRRARVWEINRFGEGIVTWKRLDDGALTLHHYQTLL